MNIKPIVKAKPKRGTPSRDVIVGIDSDGNLLLRTDGGDVYNCGENIEQFGVDNITSQEMKAIILSGNERRLVVLRVDKYKQPDGMYYLATLNIEVTEDHHFLCSGKYWMRGREKAIGKLIEHLAERKMVEVFAQSLLWNYEEVEIHTPPNNVIWSP